MRKIVKEDIFVGRADLISRSLGFLRSLHPSDTDDLPKILKVQGRGGIGKTRLLEKIREEVIVELGFDTTQVIDLKSTSNRSAISLLHAALLRARSRSLLSLSISAAFSSRSFTQAARTRHRKAHDVGQTLPPQSSMTLLIAPT